MDNQHTMIKGYRDLTQEEIDLMNRIKSLGAELEAISGDVLDHIMNQGTTSDPVEVARQCKAEPYLWHEQGRINLQQGLMFLTRAVAQPQSF
jgi:hypothetical protein